jgi:predicted dinucleotide-binding enzyme
MPNKPLIGIIGAGRLGTAIAKQSLAAGYIVRIANSQAPESLKLILSVLLPKAIAATIEDVITISDIIVLAIPLRQYRTLPSALFRGKLVIDAMNYWAPVEGHIIEFATASKTSSELVQDFLHEAILVKTLNHIAYNEIEEHASKKSYSIRRAIAMASDDAEAKKKIAVIIDNLGFDPVDLGSLRNGAKFQPDTALFNARLNAAELSALILE